MRGCPPSLRDFNSIKVQLRRAQASQGAAFRRFQFHKGTIKTVHFIQNKTAFYYFNSIKVQLRPGVKFSLKVRHGISIP